MKTFFKRGAVGKKNKDFPKTLLDHKTSDQEEQGREKNTKNINQHIIDSINFYITNNNSDYAFLITGDWGPGKTHFIDSYINQKTPTNKKIIKISLFGLSKTSEIDSAIFQELHPILGSKSARLTSNIVKGALSMGFKLDLNNNGKDESTATLKLDKLDIFDMFTAADRKKEIVIVLDDVERTGIPQKDLLGYINHLVESSKVCVIIIANEKAILEDNNKETYIKFKEKVIGKTFEVKHDHDEIITTFLHETKTKNLIQSQRKIKEIHIKSESKNLRNIKQSIFDFEYFLSRIDHKYLQNSDFHELLIWTFFALSIEIKNGILTEDTLRNNSPFFSSSAAKSPITEKLYKKYFDHSKGQIYTADLWAEILFNGNFENVNATTESLAFFSEKEIKARSDWQKLISYSELENHEFERLLKNIELSLQGEITEKATIYLHMVSLVIYFKKIGLSNADIPSLKKAIQDQINRLTTIELWSDQKIEESYLSNGTGYRYLSEEDPDFIDIKKIIAAKANKEFEKAQKILHKRSTESLSNKLLTSLTNGDTDIISKMFIKEYETTPFLNRINSKQFSDTLLTVKHITLNEFKPIIYNRYTENRLLNSRPYHFYLVEEVGFWRNVKRDLAKKTEDTTGIKKYLLEDFLTNTVTHVITVLESNKQ